MFRRLLASKLVKTSAAVGATAGATDLYLDYGRKPFPLKFEEGWNITKSFPLPPLREELVGNLESREFDVLIIGGGATGTGTAVDAVSRGLDVCLLERHDFASGTSSKSTKMAHGGVRYLEKAIFQMSKDQLDLVIEALNERGNMFRTAPHLVTVLPILIPVYKWWQVPYFFMGCKMYDWFAGHQGVRNLSIFSRELTHAVAPMIDDANLKASCVYHDGSFNDARMNATLAVTAIKNGATVLNYVEVKQLLKDESGKITSVLAYDKESKKDFVVKAKSFVNATGPFVDKLLEMDADPQGLPSKEEKAPRMCVPSSGVHVVLPERFCPTEMGLLDPSTEDGRVMFFLPWQGKVLAGTTDTPLKMVPEHPFPSEEEINDILKELQKYLIFPVTRDDVLSAWSGIRPLVRDPLKIPKGKDGQEGTTQGLVRSHLITTSPSNLLTISGGKWTTYREMAQETVDTLVKQNDYDGKGNSTLKPCQTKELVLVGGEGYLPTFDAALIQEYRIPHKLAHHLASNYGTRAPAILEIYEQLDVNKLPVGLATLNDFKVLSSSATPGNKLQYDLFDEPFTVAELKYAIKYEHARNPLDFLSRKIRLFFLNAHESLARVDGVSVVIMDELNCVSAFAE